MISPTNRGRARWAADALDTFQKATGTDAEDAVCDLLCDLMHFCDFGNCGENFDTALQRAQFHYEAEQEEE